MLPLLASKVLHSGTCVLARGPHLYVEFRLLAISKFAGRRKEAIEKVRKVADGLEREIEEAMQQDLRQGILNLKHHVEAISKPYRHAAQQRIDRLLKVQDELANVEEKLRDLKVEIQNLHAM